MIDAGHTMVLHGSGLILGVFASVALDFDHQIKGIVGASAIVHSNDEVGAITTGFGAETVGDFKSHVVVLDVG